MQYKKQKTFTWNMHPNQFTHLKDGGGTVFQNYGSFNHHMVQEPQR